MHDSKCRPNSGSSLSFTRLFHTSPNLYLQALEDQLLPLLLCLTLLCARDMRNFSSMTRAFGLVVLQQGKGIGPFSH